MIEQYNEMLDAQDKKRAAEREAREAKIKASMAKMGDVVKKNNDAELEFEARILRDAL